MIKLEKFNSKLLKIDKKHYKGINIYSIRYITIIKIDGYDNINSLNPLYFLVFHANGYIEEKNGNKYLDFDESVNPIQDGGGVGVKKAPTTSFSLVTSTNVGISSQNLLTFSFNPFPTLV